MVSFVESPWAVITAVAEQVVNVAGGSKVSAVASDQERAKHSHHSRVRCNSAIRLCYSLQLLPVVNEKHDLRGVAPSPPTQATSLQFTTMHSRRNKTSSLPLSSSPLSDDKDHQNHLLHRRRHSSQAAGEGRSIFWVPLVFALSSYVLYLLSLGFTDEDTLESHDLKFPTNMEELSEMARFLSHFKDKHWERVLVLFIAAYVYKQTFAIPGSVFLNVLSGALFGPWKGFALTALLSGVGATLCYLLSRTFGQAYVVRWFPDKVSLFQEKIEENRDSLFFFLLFLRLFPMSPNWAMNIVAPIVGIPVHLFFFSVFIGLMPYTFVCAQTGAVLSQVSSVGDIFSTQTMLSMLLAALVALLPGLVINRMHVKRSQDLSR